MRQAPKTMERLQKLWDTKRDTPATIEQIRCSEVTNFTRWYWCATFVGPGPNHRYFIVLGGNETQARHSIISGGCMARGQYTNGKDSHCKLCNGTGILF